jgi:ubiquinone/menaquinone biosynthesis C-methylase UbiE
MATARTPVVPTSSPISEPGLLKAPLLHGRFSADDQAMTRDRDVAAFDERARGYEAGWRGRFHHVIADRTADLALATLEAPRRVLDVGCGTGYLLRRLATRLPAAIELVGIDAAPSMIEVAEAVADDGRLRFSLGVAEHLPYPDQTFDLVVSTTSFDHWADQQAGLAECARVMVRGARLVLADQFSAWLLPTLLVGRRGKARTKQRATRLITRAGLHSPEWHDLYAIIIRAVTAAR